ncbi:MAG: hypothetical protein LQ352_003362 [Teloschistes flavicans]|nr:MAG: hypothetical protein LQ352_003362 [Teloschistes flavicans]
MAEQALKAQVEKDQERLNDATEELTGELQDETGRPHPLFRYCSTVRNALHLQVAPACKSGNPQEQFAGSQQAHSDKAFRKDASDEEEQSYKDLEEALFKDTIEQSGGIVTTHNKTADADFKKVHHPVLLIQDEDVTANRGDVRCATRNEVSRLRVQMERRVLARANAVISTMNNSDSKILA